MSLDPKSQGTCVMCNHSRSGWCTENQKSVAPTDTCTKFNLHFAMHIPAQMQAQAPAQAATIS